MQKKESLQSGMSLAWIGCAFKADETFVIVVTLNSFCLFLKTSFLDLLCFCFAWQSKITNKYTRTCDRNKWLGAQQTLNIYR